MEWTQTIALGGTLITYMTAMCVFFYHLNEKSIKEWRDEHKEQIAKMDAKLDKMDDRLEKMNSKWEKLFERFFIQYKEKKK